LRYLRKPGVFEVTATLADLSPGMSADILSVDASEVGVVRLMVLGLVEGTGVSCRNSAIGGDPLEIEVLGASISVRREQARHLQITVS
jgi:Fe2+ transport system protein FeoA